MLWLVTCFFWLQIIQAQEPDSSTTRARVLDSTLQDYAYRAFIRPRTGIPYDAIVPSNLTGIRVSAMRLRSGSLLTRGVPMYREFRIPIGVTERPYVERLVLVYQNLGNLSLSYYPLPGYTYLAPVLGLLAYDASNLSARNLPELDIRASAQLISIEFSNVGFVPDGAIPRCVRFDLQGSINFSNVASGNTCFTNQQGHFTIVVESLAPSPPPAILRPPPGASGQSPGSGRRRNNSRVWIIVGSVVGGLLLLVLLGLLIPWIQKYKRKKKMQQMERAAEVGESLQMTSVGTTKAPAATVTRTQPVLENEYAP